MLRPVKWQDIEHVIHWPADCRRRRHDVLPVRCDGHPQPGRSISCWVSRPARRWTV